jgi:hypothetical protein
LVFEDLMSRFAGRFARVEPRRRVKRLVLGLLSDLPRKNCWTIAEWGIRPGRTAPVHSVRPASSLITVAFFVFCLRLPETKARRPGRCAVGRRTWASVPSIRSSSPSARA